MRRRHPGAVVLLYHRIADANFDPQLLCVSPRHFAEHLKVLTEEVQLLSLEGMVAALRHRELPRRAVVVTFDDGYIDNLDTAKPLLEAHRVPATVFVATGQLDGTRGYWWDRLEQFLLWPGVLPHVLEIRLGDLTPRLELGRAARYTEPEFERYRGWTVLATDDPTPRHAAYRRLHRLLLQRGPSHHTSAIEQIGACYEPLAVNQERPAVLDAAGLGRLARGNLVQVGAHSVSHPRLAGLPVEQQCAEIEESKQQLETILGRSVTSFAYPFGSFGDYTTDTIRLVREAGFSCACANVPGVARQASDVFELPRMIVRNWDGGEFAARIESWFGE